MAETLTRIGLEVEGSREPGRGAEAVHGRKVLTAERHPQADKLQVLTVDTGGGEALQVVCGAPNARAGLVGVFGGPGTYVPGSEFDLEEGGDPRGREQRHDVLGARAELGDDHDGIIELPPTRRSARASPTMPGWTTPVFDVAITPNRQDCMGVSGIARDLAAAGLGTLKPLDVPADRGSFDNPVEIRIEDPEGCPHSTAARCAGVTNGTSPEWMQRRLKAAGQRPISALVDITNYVMLDLGRPATPMTWGA